MPLRLWEKLALYAIIAVLLVVFIGPIFWLVGVSLQTRSSLFGGGSLLDIELTFEHYANVLTSPTFGRGLVNSAWIGFLTVALSLAAGIPAAYALSVGKFRGRDAFLSSLVIMRMLPGIALLIPLYVIYQWIGLLNTHISIVLAYASLGIPLVIWIMKNFFDDVPRELEESASIDGAGRITIFAAIMLPMVRPGIVAVAILTLLTAWNEFLLAVVLTNNHTQTLPVFMAGYSSETGVDWGQLAAAGVLVTFPVIVFSFFVQKHLVSGIGTGAVKG